MVKPLWLRGESICESCIRGAPADKQRSSYFCSVKGGTKKMSESRTAYLRRSMVEAREECESYISRAWYEGEQL